MSEKPGNPELFDREIDGQSDYAYYCRITLRDLFAGLIASNLYARHPGIKLDPSYVPEFAYRAADDMLAEREKREKS